MWFHGIRQLGLFGTMASWRVRDHPVAQFASLAIFDSVFNCRQFSWFFPTQGSLDNTPEETCNSTEQRLAVSADDTIKPETLPLTTMRSNYACIFPKGSSQLLRT